MSDAASVTFLASFPNIQCIKYIGDGGARIVLDIPQSDEDAVESLRQWRDRVLMVTVVPMARGNQINRQEQVGESDGQGRVETRPKRQPKWEAAET